jgi:hypothetical protein
MANRRDDYMNRRSWLIDTAETPADKKRLKADLAKLDTQFNPNKVAKRNFAGVKTTTSTVNKTYRPMGN